MTNQTKKIINKKTMLIYSTIFLSILLVYVFCTVALPIILHKHKLVKTEEVAATCTADGLRAYWTCSDCKKMYADEAATIETKKADLVIPMKEHNPIKTNAKISTCTQEGNKNFWTCLDCNTMFADEECTIKTSLKYMSVSKMAHLPVKIKAVEATCTTEGNIEHWECSACRNLFKDESCTVRTNRDAIVIEKLAHSFAEATCTEPKTCLVCKTTEGKALGHDYGSVSYVWASNLSSCTAKRICKRDISHVDTETARSVYKDNCFIVKFANLELGQCSVFDKEDDKYENIYDGERIPTQVVNKNPGQSYELDKLGTISYPASDTAQDFDITYINGVKYKFVGMSNNAIRLYTEDDYKNFINIPHNGHHNYIAVSPNVMESLGSKVLFTGYQAKLEWFACDMEKLTAETPEYKNYALYFDQSIIGKDATPCIDFENNILYWYGYTTFYADNSEANKIIITAWDISELDLNDPRNVQVKLISQNTAERFGVMQGRKCYDGDVYVGVANTGKPFESKLLRIDATTGAIKTKLDFNAINEIEGIAVVIEGTEIKWYISDYFDFFNVKLEG